MAFIRLPGLVLLLASSLFAQYASAATKFVFAHVVVNNTKAHSQNTWENDITLAKDVGIDGFALNIVYPDPSPTQLSHAFAAAEALGSQFKLFLSFDYVNGEAWPATGDVSVVSHLNEYTNSSAYFRYTGDEIPFVSTRGGEDEGADWGQFGDIRTYFGSIYFVPEWTNLDPEDIVPASKSYEGFFDFDMWPDGAVNKTDASDLAYKHLGAGGTYMMGVSPWFFHSAHPGKNWVWRGDDLWHDRWNQTLLIKPDFVEIVSWNDFGSSHYIGPIHFKSEAPAASDNYLEGHEPWRDFLPYYIAKYKGKAYTITTDQMQYWYHRSPDEGGYTCGVVGNNADMGQTELAPSEVAEDAIFFSALLTAPAQVVVKLGGFPATAYSAVTGINHWSRAFDGQVGIPTFSIVRGGVTVGSGAGKDITAKTTLFNGCTNYNAWVGSFSV